MRSVCENEASARTALAPKVAETLKHRLADLLAATSVVDLVAGAPYQIDDGESQQMAVNLGEGFRIIFCANHTKNPISDSGVIDWKSVRRIKILEIANDTDK